MKVHFITFGCKVNICETDAMAEAFRRAGYEITVCREEADIFVINSCTVTAESDSKLMQTLRRIKRDFPHSVTAVTGCFPQAFPEKASAPDFPADIIVGNTMRSDLPRLAGEYFGTGSPQPVCRIIPHSPGEAFEEIPVQRSCPEQGEHTRAFLKIQDGCPGGCAYCIIPKARGNIRSKPLQSIISETEALAAQGYKEIVLTGINLAFYGCDLKNGPRLADAARAVCSASGIERVRIGSLEPEMIKDSDISRLAALKNLCPSFHLSLQSGCAATLAAMKRRYTPEMYRELTAKLRRAFPDCGITTDIMTGFPGETEKDHICSMEFARKIGFSSVHIFPYSPREGTPAADMPQVPDRVKKRRAKEFTELAAKLSLNFRQSLVGKDFPVLFEREKADKIHHGYTPNYVHVKILTKNSEKSLRNSIFYVTIDKIGDDCCYGRIIPNKT